MSGLLRALAVAAAIAVGAPAFAGQQPAVDLGASALLAPPPADTGKPAIVMPPPAQLSNPEPAACMPGLPCGTRLIGEVRKDGAVELQVPVLRW